MGLRISQMTAAIALLGGELAELAQKSTTVTYTATTISALASDNSYNDSANQFLVEGFAVDDAVCVLGFTGNVANNINSAVITALTAGKMTIGGIDGDVIVDDAAGESVTIVKWNTVRATIQEILDLVVSSSSTAYEFTSDTGSTADSDPTNGLFKWNNGTQSSATKLFFSDTTADAIDLTVFLAALPATGYIKIVQNDDPTKWVQYKQTAKADDGDYFDVTVTFMAQGPGGAIADNKACSVIFDSDEVSAGGGASLSATNSWTKSQTVADFALTDAGTVAVNYAESNNFYLLLTAAVGATRAMGTPSNATSGGTFQLKAQQPASGGPCAITWPADFVWGKGGSGTAPTGSTTASAVDTYAFAYNLATTKWHGFMIDTATVGSGAGTKTQEKFYPADYEPAGTNYPTPDVRNNTMVLDFDGSADETCYFTGIINEGAILTSGLKVRITGMATSATSGDYVWEVAFERTGTDRDGDSFDTVATGTGTTSGTAGIESVVEITITTIDSLAAGERFRMRLARKPTNGSDTITTDIEFVSAEVRTAN